MPVQVCYPGGITVLPVTTCGSIQKRNIFELVRNSKKVVFPQSTVQKEQRVAKHTGISTQSLLFLGTHRFRRWLVRPAYPRLNRSLRLLLLWWMNPLMKVKTHPWSLLLKMRNSKSNLSWFPRSYLNQHLRVLPSRLL